MAELQITLQSTPNPNAAKFTLNRELPDGSGRSYFDAEAARGDQLAERLFEVEGVRALLLVDNFITVTKTDEKEWPDLVERIESVIREELSPGT
jgi:hypothetical protein